MRNGDATCQCGLATRLVGDGCERCNPQLAIQLLKEQVADMRLTDAEREALRKVLRRVREDYFAGRFADSVEVAAVIDGLLERTH
jgi:hypothetical protein